MNIAVISYWHVHARDYSKQLGEVADAKISHVWDDDAARGKEKAQEYGAEFVADYDALLANPAIDGIVMCAQTTRHKELLVKAADAKKHIFTEKVLATTAAEAEDILAAIRRNKVAFTISLPFKSSREGQYIQRAVAGGKLGRVAYARVRDAHSGSINDWLPAHFYDARETGGGAMIDLGAHPMYLLAWFLGMPQSMTSTFTKYTGRAVEDNAVSVFEYADGCIAVSETGFVSGYSPITAEVYGSEGSIVWHRGVSLKRAGKDTDGKWVDVPESELPPEKPSAIRLWTDAIRAGGAQPAELGPDDALALTRLMEAAYKASASGARAPVA